MNYIISGQSGFIGSAITNYLLARGQNVVGIQRPYSISKLKRVFKETNPDYIVHLATYGNHCQLQRKFGQMVATNITGTYNLLEAADEWNYKVFYNVSTSSVGLKIQTYYSITKLCGEMLAGLYDRVVNVRPYSVYGPGEAKHRFIPKIMECLITGEQLTIDEKATHDWIFISDFIVALFAGETDIGTGVKSSNKEIVEMLQQISGKKLNYTAGKVRTYDNNDWVAKSGVSHIGIYEGLKRTYEHFTK